MIELEIQGLSDNREGLLIEVGRRVMASGFTLQRQRLVQDPHGILLTMVVRGLSRKRRALEAALNACDRLISFNVAPFVEGESKPHFAASRKRMESAAAAPSTPMVSSAVTAPIEVPAAPAEDSESRTVEPDAASISAALESWQEPSPEPDFEFILPTPRPPAPTPAAPVDPAPFVEMVALKPDEAAVEKVLRELEHGYPRIVPQLLALERSVVDGARESSLMLAGQRTGAWVFEREYALDTGLDLCEAIERIGAPALRALVEVDQQGTQLHIHESPLCMPDGHSGCSFFSGFLEGLLGPVIAPVGLSIFPVCCRSYGAGECVLAVSA